MQTVTLEKAEYIVPNHAQTQHDFSEVMSNYKDLFFSDSNETNVIINPKSFCYHITFQVAQEPLSSIFMLRENLPFPYKGSWEKDKLFYLIFTFPKGCRVNLEDEKGPYYIYEPVTERAPLSYNLYVNFTNQINLFTKPFRFFSEIARNITQEQKPSGVRISKDAAALLQSSRVFQNYNLKMKSFQ